MAASPPRRAHRRTCYVVSVRRRKHSSRSNRRAATVAGLPLLLAPALAAAEPAWLADLGSADRVTIFWIVLAVFLGIGCLAFLFHRLLERKISENQGQLKTLQDLAETVVASSDIGPVQQRATEILPDVAGATHCFLLRLNAATQQLEYVAGSHRPPASAVALAAMSGPGTCFRNQVTTDVPDAENCPFVDREVVRRLSQKSLLYVPLLAEGQCVGVLELEDRRRKRVFTAQELGHVLHVANLLAMAWKMEGHSSLEGHVFRAEKATFIRDFIEGLAEQLSDPLGRIRSLADRSRSETNQAAAVRCLAEADHQAEEALGVLRRVSRLVRPREGGEKPVEMNAVLRDAIEALRPRWERIGFTARMQLSRRPARASLDSDSLRELAKSLLHYAERMLRGDGGNSLQVATSLIRNEFWLLSIRSSDAVGGSPSNPAGAAAWDDDPQGGMLGLLLCRGLVEAMGGALRVDEEGPRGFLMELEFPLAAAPSPTTDSAPAEQARRVNAQPATALVIEENQETKEQLVQLIAAQGYRAIPVETVAEGTDLCDRMEFDCVFCAARVGRVTGVEVYRQVRHRVHKFVLVMEGKAPQTGDPAEADGLSVLAAPFTAAQVGALLDSTADQGAVQ